MNNMNLKPKCKPSWHSFFSKNFIAIYLALALVLVINQVIFSYALKDRENAKAITSNLISEMFWAMPNITAHKGTNNVVIATGAFPDSMQNENLACTYELQGNSCISLVEADGMGSNSAGTDDDGITNIYKLPTYQQPFNNVFFQSSDQMCVDSLTSPTCVYYDSDGDCSIGTGTPTRLLGSACGSFSDINMSTSALPYLFAHSEVVKQNGAYDYCGGPNSPACPNNSSGSIRADATGTKCGPLGNGPLTIPVWDDITGDNLFTPGVDTIYWDPNHCLTGAGVCAGGGCVGTPTGSPMLIYLSSPTSCRDRVWDDSSSNDGVFTLGVDSVAWDPTHCLTNGMSGYKMIEPAKYTESIWSIHIAYDVLLKQGSDWGSPYIGQWQGYLAPAWTSLETYKDSGVGHYTGTEPVVIDNDSSGTFSPGDFDVYGIGGLAPGDPLTQLSSVVGPHGFPLIKTQAGGATTILTAADSILEDEGNITTGTTPNGYIDRPWDILDRGMFTFTGSLVPERDITNLRLYVDFGSSGICDASDTYAMDFSYNGTYYLNDTFPFLALPVETCIIADIPSTAIGGSTGSIKIPQFNDVNSNGFYDSGDAGFFYYSGNNGPRDADLIFPYSITIVPLPRNSGAGTGQDLIPPGSPENVKIKASANGTVQITWTDPSDADLSQIIIDENASSANTISAVERGIQSLLLSGRKVGSSYDYNIRAKDTGGNYSSDQIYTVVIPSEGDIEVTLPTYLAAPLIPSLPAGVSVGDIVKSDKTADLFFVGADHKKHVFPNQAIYNSWYADFSKVKTISEADLDMLVSGTDIVVREGTYLVKRTSASKIYAVDNNGLLLWVSSERILNDLYGTNWKNRLLELPDNIFNKYTIGPTMVAVSQANGSLISYRNSNKVYYIDNGQKREVTKDIFAKNNYQDKFVSKNIDTDINYNLGAPMTLKNTPTYFLK